MNKITVAGFFVIAIFLSLPKSYGQALGSFDAVILSSTQPPQMADYDQPPCPLAGQLWQPGYWSYDSTLSDYYWVPGDWVAPPQEGLLWTPGYWELANNLYDFHPGYWGTDVGFYGGINYGFGYSGLGYTGGTWKHHHFRYNTAVTHVDKKVVHDTYVDNTVVVNNAPDTHISFNGKGGIIIKPRPDEERAIRERHFEPTEIQISHQQAARENRSQFASFNHGRPTTTYLNKANTSTFMTEASRNPVHNHGPESTNPGTTSRPAINAAHHNNTHSGSNMTRQQQRSTQHTSQHLSQQHSRQRTQQHTNQHSQQAQRTQQQHTSQQQQRAQQHTGPQPQQHTTPQRSSQPHNQAQQHAAQPRVQQQHAFQPRAQQPRVQRQQRVQQPKAQQPRKTN